jgi:hypothetical protein
MRLLHLFPEHQEIIFFKKIEVLDEFETGFFALKYFSALFFETFNEGFRIEIGICKALVDAGEYAFILCG